MNGFFEMLKELVRWIGIIIVFGMFILWMEGAFTKGCLQLLFTMVEYSYGAKKKSKKFG